MEPRYDAAKFEQEIYRKWEKSRAFRPESKVQKDKKDEKDKFCIIMPPPNANDPLHIGHAMFVTVEDIMIRYQRMKGKAVLWLPGTDHAGIETQYVFEKKLNKEGKSRLDFDRKTLYQMIFEYVKRNSDVAINQMKRLGASADWSRLAFTLDPNITDQVIDTFTKLHNDGLVYRDLRLVNYCTHCGTSFSNLEVKDVVRKDPFIYIKYGPFTIGTVRPETKFRDTALAVHPNDPRYKKHIGKTYEVIGLLGPISMTVIADPGVDPKFGTGIMKVTPAHDFHDFDLGKKYNLPITPIITPEGRMDFSWFLEKKDISDKYRDRARRYQATPVGKARQMMIEDLKTDGLLVKVDENYEHSVATCYKCGTVLEPLPLPQFFVKTKPLAKKALEALEKKQIRIIGAGHDKILKHWLTNIQDWNVSRQIVWGIRMPVWYCAQSAQPSIINHQSSTITNRPPLGTHYVVSKEKPKRCPECGGTEFIQETDTFDTWFSSGQWPVVTLRRGFDGELSRTAQGKRHKNDQDDFERFYPTDVMETAYEILFFWVARMMMLGIYLTDKIPFQTVYLHGLIRDEKGQKMSKSKGNVIDPLTVVDKYGADALRMALVIRSTPGLDKATGEGDIRAMRNLTNKVWNASRYVAMQLAPLYASQSRPDVTSGRVMELRERDSGVPTDFSSQKNPGPSENAAHGDKGFYKRLNKVVETVTKQLDDYRIGLAAETLYNEFWHWFCDECIEQNKKGELSDGALLRGLVIFLKLLHPFVPFVTEAVWGQLREQLQQSTGNNQLATLDSQMLITAPWPKTSPLRHSRTHEKAS